MRDRAGAGEPAAVGSAIVLPSSSGALEEGFVILVFPRAPDGIRADSAQCAAFRRYHFCYEPAYV
jgi:hypothetical protein